ncbi:MAG: hypothetical protein ACJAXI_001531 [Crocinitomicaceae bacterium]|jgi:hypothetical protein
MIKKVRNTILAFTLFLMPTVILSQTLIPFGLISTFEAYTGIGAATNSGLFTGDVGTDAGALAGFTGPPTFFGTTYNNNPTTIQARADMLWMYINLNNLPVTDFTHLAAFGGGESLTPGVYSVSSAGSLSGTITLNGGVNDFFIFKFEGAFTAGAGATIVLAGGVQAANVFWIANGAITVTPTLVSNPTTIKGSLFSYPGAISLGSNCALEGRLLTTNGAISTGLNSVAMIPPGPCTIPVPCLSACNPVHDVLGTINNFIFFTNNGAVTNVSTSGIVGNVGAHVGSISGFGSSTHVGSFHLGPLNAITNQAALDLNNAYALLMAIPSTVMPAHGSAFGLPTKPGEILTPGVYDIAAAANLTGFITLDGGGDPNAVFIIRVNGAFSVASRARVILANGTRVCNVFWIATGAHAIDMGTWSFVRGTVIAGGACTMAASGNLEGRMLSRNGAVGFSTGTAYNDPLCNIPAVLPVELLSFNAEAIDAHIELNWSTASEINNDYFNVERSSDGVNFTSILKVNGADNSSQILNYTAVDNASLSGISYYRLKQTDNNGQIDYSSIVSVDFNKTNDFIINVYPNPNDGEGFNLQLFEKNAEILIVVYDILGNELYSEVIITSLNNHDVYAIHPSKKLNSGVYLILATSGNKIDNKRLIVK